MDRIKFFEVSNLLKSMKSNFPAGDEIGLNHVEDFHSFLHRLAEQVELDLAAFQIPASAIKSRQELTSLRQGRTGWHSTSKTIQYCDPDVFRRQLDGVIGFIEAVADDFKKSRRDSAPKDELTIKMDPPK